MRVSDYMNGARKVARRRVRAAQWQSDVSTATKERPQRSHCRIFFFTTASALQQKNENVLYQK